MPCVEYHLLLILICLMKSGINLNLGKKICVGLLNIHKEYPQQVFGTAAGD